jgi:hypothetical protein
MLTSQTPPPPSHHHHNYPILCQDMEYDEDLERAIVPAGRAAPAGPGPLPGAASTHQLGHTLGAPHHGAAGGASGCASGTDLAGRGLAAPEGRGPMMAPPLTRPMPTSAGAGSKAVEACVGPWQHGQSTLGPMGDKARGASEVLRTPGPPRSAPSAPAITHAHGAPGRGDLAPTEHYLQNLVGHA